MLKNLTQTLKSIAENIPHGEKVPLVYRLLIPPTTEQMEFHMVLDSVGVAVRQL